ncbi:hypothetical protein OESDEN_02013 [Oesophagostomum dentatum]|uniref:Uncharacterized protein n=1 Tax=Oesophagostomum dentatum TaxID=61180 RepID=A0A0B1TL71_OESDE|nr:hypothetical protein OESDEN_02013 [Oesophagostomum dentatum]
MARDGATVQRMTIENHYISRNEITSQQKAKIAELRGKAAKHLAKYPDYDTDFSLLRWLMGWDYDVGDSACNEQVANEKSP